MDDDGKVVLDLETLANKFRGALGREIDERLKAETLVDMLVKDLKTVRDALQAAQTELESLKKTQ